MEEYANITSMDTVDGIFEYANSLSNRHGGKQNVTWHQKEMADVFSKIMLHYVGMLRFIPSSKFYSPTAELNLRDISSAAALARAVLEGYAVFFYLFVEGVDDLESEYRKLIWLYHGEFERKAMLKLALPNSEGIGRLEKRMNKAQSNLINCQKLKSFNLKQQQEVLKCKTAHDGSVRSILSRAGISEHYFSSNYKYFSNFVHTTAFSVEQMGVTAEIGPMTTKLFNAIAVRTSGFAFMCVRDFAGLNGESGVAEEKLSNALRTWEGVFKWEKLNLL